MNKKLIWIGAGSATSSEINFDNFDSILLVEARKEACDELNENFADNVKVTIKQVCISDRNEELEFFQCNVEELSALAKPAELKSLYPGLTVSPSFDVDTIDIIDFLKEELVDECTELFIDTPATSCKLVRKLFESEFRDRITKLYVSIGTVPALYEGSSDLKALSSILKANFFDEIAIDTSDPDIPIVTFKLNQNLKALEKLKAENSKLKQQLAEAKQHTEQVENILNCLNLDLAQKNELIEAKDIEIQALNREIATYKLECQKKGLDCDELSKQLDLSKSANLVLQNELSEERAKIAMLTRELKEQANKLKVTEETYESLKNVERKAGEELASNQAKLAELTEEFEAQASTLHATFETLERSKKSEIKKIEELTESQANYAKLRKEFEATKEKLEVVLGEVEHAKEVEQKTRDELSEYESRLKELQLKVNDVNAINLNLSKSLDISSKQNLKLQTDLNDLRQQFSVHQENEKRLKALIGELHEKLSRAASFYHRLEKSNPELLGHNDE